MKSIHEQIAHKAEHDLKSNGLKGWNICAGHYNYKGHMADQLRLVCDTPKVLMKAKEVLKYVKWTDLTPTMAASVDEF